MARRAREKQRRREEREREARLRERDRTLKLIAIAAIVLVLAVGIAYLALNGLTVGSRTGTPAPDFTLLDSDGNTFRLSQFRGRPVVLFFMTTAEWCEPCKVETRDHLIPLYSTYGSRIQIISIEMLSTQYSNADLNSYKVAYGSPWIYARDTAGVAQLYSVTTLSTVIIVDQSGSIVFRGSDPTYDQMSAVLRNLGL